ncbi:hypothetical protein GRI97_01060 [Altererythrobacter xixiisoli]|uniref:UrcA family protein n=1 Tax=Croceibacterium xixiisoli TaxID=1476466 RepID=A0A6I4TP64_9SPHN|nr:hypothetical protein [Croceibacterium xixiisoli]MXO97576.1 hypothetical protein [Croceibacterium xixiisoli]
MAWFALLLLPASPLLAAQQVEPDQHEPAQTEALRELPATELPPVEPAPANTRIGTAAPQGPCVIVDIAGEQAGHLDCATRRLAQAARIAQDQARAGIDAPVSQAGSPDTRIGIANQSATRLRMGSGFGTSVHAERPATRPPRVPRP